MSIPFSQTTAEHLVYSINAVYCNNNRSTVEFVSEFSSISTAQAKAALDLAVNLEVLKNENGEYCPHHPLGKLLIPSEDDLKISILSFLLESYKPFESFCQRIKQHGDSSDAARETKALLELDAEISEIRDTLLDLGTYCQILKPEGAGKFKLGELSFKSKLNVLAKAAVNFAESKKIIKEKITEMCISHVNETEVVDPLSQALLRVDSGNYRDAIVHAGNAIDSFLTELSNIEGISPIKHGINSMLVDLKSKNKIPTKIQNMGFYLGHIRNGADHGVDSEINASWDVSADTSLEYIFVSCSFIRAVISFRNQVFKL